MATINDLDEITSFNDTDQLYISQGVLQDKRIAVSAFLDSVESELSVVTLTGDQEIAGEKTFTTAIVADVTGDLTGNVLGNVTGDLTGNADTVTNGVYTTGDQTIGGVKTFSAIPAFNGGESGVSAPMTVDSTDVVTNLNADKFDGADLSTDGTLGGNSDTDVPTEKAVKTYADTKMSKSGDETIADVKTFTSIPVLPASDPTTDNQASRKAYVDSTVSTSPQTASAWVNFNGTGEVTIRDDYNVDSITDNNTGDYTVNIDVDLDNANYSVTSCGTQTTSATRKVINIDTLLNGSFRVATSDGASGAREDFLIIMIHVFGGKA